MGHIAKKNQVNTELDTDHILTGIVHRGVGEVIPFLTALVRYTHISFRTGYIDAV